MLEIRFNSGDPIRWRHGAIVGAVLLFVLYLAWLVREIWLPLAIAFLIAMVLDPIVDRLERRGWSRLWGALLIYVLFFSTLAVTLTFAVPAVVSQTKTISDSIGQYLPTETGKPGEEKDTRHKLKLLLRKLHATPYVSDTVLRASGQISRGVSSASAWFGNFAKAAVSNLLWVVIIPLVAFYALKDLHIIYARLLMILPRESRPLVQDILNKISKIFVQYLRGLVIVCALNAVVTYTVLLLFHVPNALGLGAISGALYMVPYLGAALTITLIGGVCLMSPVAGSTLIVVGTMIVVHHVFFDNVVTPRVVGKQVGLHPILSIMALLSGGALLGILGMILAVPLAATIQMLLLAMFPRLGNPIEVPTGEQLQVQVNDTVGRPLGQTGGTETQDIVDVHQTIVTAVDNAEREAKQHEQELEAQAPIVIGDQERRTLRTGG